MSNPLAIAAVTSTLRFLLERELTPFVSDITVTTYPPDRAFDSSNPVNQLNLFLYHTTTNPAWANRDFPNQPPLALNLHYLLTAYSRTQDFPIPLSHQFLGRAMVFLHDHAILLANDIKNALGTDLVEHDLYDQIEKVKITPHNLSLEELYKLWSTFQTGYRISACYEASVVLLQSSRPTRVALPVLQRGFGDRGPILQPDLLPPYPLLLEATPPNGQPAVRLGDTLVLSGSRLDGDVALLRFSNARITEAVPAQILSRTRDRIEIQILDTPADPTAPDRWVVGIYGLTVVFHPLAAPDALTDRPTNTLPVVVAPRITGLSATAALVQGQRVVTIEITCTPKVRSGQQAVLFLSDQGNGPLPLPINNQALTATPQAPQMEGDPIVQTDTLEFLAGDIPAGNYQVRPRLQIDGIDSFLVQDYTATPMAFIPFQLLTVPA